MVCHPRRLPTNRADDAKSLRNEHILRQIEAANPPNPTCKGPLRYDTGAYTGRNVIDRMFCELKDS